MKNFKAIVDVGLKPTIKDIKAITLADAVEQITDVKNFHCKLQNRYILEFSAQNRDTAQKTVQLIAEEILANSVIEEYEIHWVDLNE